MTGIQPLNLLLLRFFALLGRFFARPDRASKTNSKKHRKKLENRGFGAPQIFSKSCQNAIKIDVPKNMRFFIDFCSKNALLQECRHRFRIVFSNTKWLSDTFLHIAFCLHFRSEKPTKNSSKTTPEPFKNQCRKRMEFCT